DGIRDFHVTGVQTCALPISFVTKAPNLAENDLSIGDFVLQDALQDVLFVGVELGRPLGLRGPLVAPRRALLKQTRHGLAVVPQRSEERRVGKGCGSAWSPEA